MHCDNRNPIGWLRMCSLLAVLWSAGTGQSLAQHVREAFTDSFDLSGCTFSATGRNTYFILEPGYRIMLLGMEEKDTVLLIVTVMDETRPVRGVETRVVEEREVKNGETVEVSRNFFAVCKETGTVFYFGEEVDLYEEGKVTGHEGSWLAEGPNRPGMAMPGQPVPGDRYYQEYAPGVAMDRGEIAGLDGTLKTRAGTFNNVLTVTETNALKPGEKESKMYIPGVGLGREEDLLLVRYGFIDKNGWNLLPKFK